MNQSIDKLLAIASEPVGSRLEGTGSLRNSGPLGMQLAEMLNLKNGFYAYESALLVRPSHHDGAPLGLLEWNAPKLWMDEYEEDLSGALFFAEDAFGGQYCIRDDTICTFDPESGLFERMSTSLNDWASEVLSDYHFRTGYPLAHEWQIANGPLSVGVRLLPKTPFVCGGKYELDNLFAAPDVQGMLFRASIANQIRDLPDGADIIIRNPSNGSMH